MSDLQDRINGRQAMVAIAIIKSYLEKASIKTINNCALIDDQFNIVRNLELVSNVRYDEIIKAHFDRGHLTQDVFTAVVDLIKLQYEQASILYARES
jgi:hypothetical protein